VQLPIGPIIVATVTGARSPVAAQIRYAEDTIRKRVGDPSATLLVRAITTNDITSKGRLLLGEARFAPMEPADRSLQKQLEQRGKTELERIPNTFVYGIDAAKISNGWTVRAEVVSAKTLQPADVGKVERDLREIAHNPVNLSVLNPDGLIVRHEGFTTVQRAVEEGFLRQLEAQGESSQGASDSAEGNGG
ncbi:MAG: hypothetical protein ACU843_05000, partial [Gammaproteobacteria bacterium]